MSKLNKNIEQIEGLTKGQIITQLPATVIVDGYPIEITKDGYVKIVKEANKEEILQKILKMLNIEKSYTLEDLANNKDGILTKALEDINAVKEIVKNKSTFLDPLTNSEIAILEIAKSQNMKEEIINNEPWVKKVIEKGKSINGFDENMQTIPKMTSNTEPEGEASTNFMREGFEPYRAFDRDSETKWAGYSVSSKPSIMPYVMYKYNKQHSVYKIEVNTTSGTMKASSDVLIEIYISEKKEGEDSWEKVHEEKLSWPDNAHETEYNITCNLDKIYNIQRVKICNLYYNTWHQCWLTQCIHEVKVYGI